MSVTHVVGIDPGLVHTGVVLFTFNTAARRIYVDYEAISGPDVVRAQQFLGGYRLSAHVFIEGYRQRSHFGTDAEMVKAVQDFKAGFLGSQVLQNTGVKKVVTRALMELLEVWSFPTKTHHQDLRSAARIALYGMLKQEALNRILSDVVKHHTEGRSWYVAS